MKNQSQQDESRNYNNPSGRWEIFSDEDRKGSAPNVWSIESLAKGTPEEIYMDGLFVHTSLN